MEVQKEGFAMGMGAIIAILALVLVAIIVVAVVFNGGDDSENGDRR